jgi:hypothetical protein
MVRDSHVDLNNCSLNYCTVLRTFMMKLLYLYMVKLSNSNYQRDGIALSDKLKGVCNKVAQHANILSFTKAGKKWDSMGSEFLVNLEVGPSKKQTVIRQFKIPIIETIKKISNNPVKLQLVPKKI